MGGTHFIECNSAAKDIWQFCTEREIWISAALILEKKNTQANRESRVFIDNKRWNCQARHISTSYKNLVEPPFDRSVSKLSAQVSCHTSWRPDPDETYVDVFLSHKKQFFYAFPLFSLITHWLHKIVSVEAEGMNDCFLLATQPCIAVMPDSRCGKDTSTATEHPQNARERAWGSSINKEDVANGFQIIRESLIV